MLSTLSAFTPRKIHLVDFHEKIFEYKNLFYNDENCEDSITEVESLSNEIKSNSSENKPVSLSHTIPGTKSSMSRKESITSAKRESANRDAFQQHFLIATMVLLKHTVVIAKPRKKSTKTAQLYVIESITNASGEKVFDHNEVVATSSDEKINRRNFDSYVNNKMIEIARNNNCFVDFRETKKALKTTQYERIERIVVNGIQRSQSEIREIGEKTNERIQELIKSKHYILTLEDFTKPLQCSN